jgi:hypothetical protein
MPERCRVSISPAPMRRRIWVPVRRRPLPGGERDFGTAHRTQENHRHRSPGPDMAGDVAGASGRPCLRHGQSGASQGCRHNVGETEGAWRGRDRPLAPSGNTRGGVLQRVRGGGGTPTAPRSPNRSSAPRYASRSGAAGNRRPGVAVPGKPWRRRGRALAAAFSEKKPVFVYQMGRPQERRSLMDRPSSDSEKARRIRFRIGR